MIINGIVIDFDMRRTLLSALFVIFCTFFIIIIIHIIYYHNVNLRRTNKTSQIR